MLNDSIKVTGELRITVTNPEGNIKQEIVVPNLVVTTGKNFIASRMKDTTDTAMSHMAIGSGTTSAVVGDTAPYRLALGAATPLPPNFLNSPRRLSAKV